MGECVCLLNGQLVTQPGPISDLECGWVLFAFILFWPLESIVLV